MTQPTARSSDGSFESTGDVKTIVVNYDRAVTQNIPVLKFPGAGRIVSASISGEASSSGTNVIQVGLINGGVAASGTIQTAALSSGTLTVGTPVSMTVATDGKQNYAAGEWAVLQIVTANAITDVQVQIDYRVDNF